ncbi:tyrosine-type recombinase/integrase [Mesorhizobium sp. XAP10]|uniref:tyrosine-type recombinase/integrase n=1 Tax=unclassified Mesorhizobium TaxID=325217 RepID=UPI0023DFDC8B|nr:MULTISPECIES: tyrosine-type recombinase/integrase [unclassified Mesorhizobium]MDF3154785.1 tyrosine-type recombinase/integrase [Mesorhizobium sp. XAP10]MDF3247665.1 tyrosine-type recombinase/integrase [Mesorhizobium sp. XAP4]
MNAPLKKFTCADAWAIYTARHTAVYTAHPETQDYNWKNLGQKFGNVPVGKVDQNLVDEYVAARTCGAIGKPSTAATMRRELALLLAAIRFCANRKRRLIPPEDVPAFDLPPASMPRERWLRDYELKAFFATAAKHRTRSSQFGDTPRLSRVERFAYIALESGARKQAILDLSWDRVDFKIGVIYFDVPGRRRTKKRRAAVPISSLLRRVLLRAFRERISNLVLDNGGGVWAPIQHIAMKAGLFIGTPVAVPAGTKPPATGIGPHTFRHTCATNMVRNGVSLWKVAKILGNSVLMIERVYGHHTAADLLDAVEKISTEWRPTGDDSDLDI